MALEKQEIKKEETKKNKFFKMVKWIQGRYSFTFESKKPNRIKWSSIYK